MNVSERIQGIFEWLDNRVKRVHRTRRLPWFISVLCVSRIQWVTRWLCFTVFFPPLCYYFLFGWPELQNRSQTLEVGLVTIAAALGGLVLNAGVNLKGRKRRETILVAQEFIAVVILMIFFVPSLYFVELMDGIDTNSFEPGSSEAWVRGTYFWIAAASFFGGIILFIFALVDLVFAMGGIRNTRYGFQRK